MQTETKQNKRSVFFPFPTLVVVLFALVFLIAACGRNREEPTPIPSPTPLFNLEGQNASDSDISSDGGQADTGQSEDGQAEPEVGTTETDQAPIDGLVAQINTAQLQLRVAPGEEAEVIRLLDEDERFVVLGQNVDGTWVKLVRHGERVGWAATQYVNLLPATAEEIETLTQPPAETAEDGSEEGQATQVITPGSLAIIDADYLNVRGEPAVDSAISLLAQRGQQFEVTSVSDDGAWLQIAVDGEPLGWVSSEFVLIEEQGATESVTEAETEEEASSEGIVADGGETVIDEAEAESDVSAVDEIVDEPEEADETASESDSEESVVDSSDDGVTVEDASAISTEETQSENAVVTVVEPDTASDTSAESDEATTEAVSGETAEESATTAVPEPEIISTAILDGPVEMNGPDFGAQAFLWWREEIADRDLNLMNEAGFNWVKQTFAWEDIEWENGQFRWSTADRVVQQINSSGLKLLARVSSDPLAEFWGGHPPGNATDYAEFIFTLADRYNCTPEAVGCIHAFQIWNEPNLAREWGDNRPNPAEYTAFLGRAYNAVKVANPNALVINAGMAPTGDNSDIAMPDDLFYREMYAAMGGNSTGFFDLLGVHGAGFAAPPELDPAEAAAPDSPYGGYRFFSFRHVEDIREIMVENGDEDKQIVLLEFGWTYDSVNPSYKWHGGDAGIDAALQGKYLLRAYEFATENWQPWIGLMSLLTMPNLAWLDDGDPEDEEQYWWAILEPSPIDQLYFRPAYVELCIYFNGTKGQRCIYDPN